MGHISPVSWLLETHDHKYAVSGKDLHIIRRIIFPNLFLHKAQEISISEVRCLTLSHFL